MPNTWSRYRHHADPFDRMLIAQARVEGATVVTQDPQFEQQTCPSFASDDR